MSLTIAETLVKNKELRRRYLQACKEKKTLTQIVVDERNKWLAKQLAKKLAPYLSEKISGDISPHLSDSLKYVMEESQDKKNEEEFEMVILLSWLELPSHMRELNEKLGLNLKGKSFWETEDISLKKTAKPGVFFAGSVFAP